MTAAARLDLFPGRLHVNYTRTNEGDPFTSILSFMITRSCRFGDCFHRELLPEYTTCLGWMAAVILPTSPMENRNRASLKATE